MPFRPNRPATVAWLLVAALAGGLLPVGCSRGEKKLSGPGTAPPGRAVVEGKPAGLAPVGLRRVELPDYAAAAKAQIDREQAAALKLKIDALKVEPPPARK